MTASRITQDWPLRMTITSPVAHNGDVSTGNTSLFRRIRVQAVDGTPIEVPAISGNSLRGQLRRIAARRFLEAIGLRVEIAPYHFMFSGGAIEKGSKRQTRAVVALREMRDHIPMVGLFGGAWKAELMPGALRVGWIWPVCREMKHITGIASPVAAKQILDVIFYTRRGDRVTEDDSQMIFEVEAMTPGVQLVGELSVSRATELEVGCLSDAVTEWLSDPRLGGMAARGHGRVRVRETDLRHGAAYASWLESERDRLRTWVQEHIGGSDIVQAAPGDGAPA